MEKQKPKIIDLDSILKENSDLKISDDALALARLIVNIANNIINDNKLNKGGMR